MSVSAVSNKTNPFSTGAVTPAHSKANLGSSFADAVANGPQKLGVPNGDKTNAVAGGRLTTKAIDPKTLANTSSDQTLSAIQAQIDYASGKLSGKGNSVSAVGGKFLPPIEPKSSFVDSVFDPLAVVKMGLVSEDNSFVRAIEAMLGIVPGSITNPSKLNTETSPQVQSMDLIATEQANDVGFNPAPKDTKVGVQTQSVTKYVQSSRPSATSVSLPPSTVIPPPPEWATRSMIQDIDKTTSEVLMKLNEEPTQA